MKKSDILSDMRKINARDFQKQFGKIASSLAEGQSIEVTKHGKALGEFRKFPVRTVKLPDFCALLDQHPYPPAVGNKILKEFNDSLS